MVELCVYEREEEFTLNELNIIYLLLYSLEDEGDRDRGRIKSSVYQWSAFTLGLSWI